MSDSMIVILRWPAGGSPDEMLTRYEHAAALWRTAHPEYTGPAQTFAGRSGDDLVVLNLFATDSDHLAFGKNMGPHLEEAGLRTPAIEHVPLISASEAEATVG